MKRSEMIQKLEYLIYQYHPQAPSAESVLDFLENHGMLPPIEESAKQYKILCHWDPENPCGAV